MDAYYCQEYPGDAAMEIARLKAEVDRLNIAASMADHVLYSKRKQIHNDAIEADAQELDAWHDIYGNNAAAAIRALKK